MSLMDGHRRYEGQDRQALFRIWLEKIVSEGINLTVWEEGFIEDLASQMENQPGIPFSERQGEIIERIYTQRVP